MQSAEPVKVVICISIKPNFNKSEHRSYMFIQGKTKVTYPDRLLIYPNSIASVI